MRTKYKGVLARICALGREKDRAGMAKFGINKLATKKSMTLYPGFGHEALLGDDDMVFRFLATR